MRNARHNWVLLGGLTGLLLGAACSASGGSGGSGGASAGGQSAGGSGAASSSSTSTTDTAGTGGAGGEAGAGGSGGSGGAGQGGDIGPCASCRDREQSDVLPLCPGTSEELWNDYWGCVCEGTCAAACAENYCVGSGESGECQQCRLTPGAGCLTQYNACLNDS